MTAPALAGQSRRLRLFVAIDVPEQVCAAIEAAVAPLRDEAPGLRWSAPEGRHLTVAFLGSVHIEEYASIDEAVAGVATSAHPFTLRLSGTAGTFSGGVLWAGVEVAPLLDELAGALRERFAALGHQVEDRPFRGHVTLARTARGSRLPEWLPQRYHGPRLPWTVRSLALMRSRLAVGGARYDVCGDYPLG